MGHFQTDLSVIANNGSIYGDDSVYQPSTRESSYVVGGDLDLTGKGLKSSKSQKVGKKGKN